MRVFSVNDAAWVDEVEGRQTCLGIALKWCRRFVMLIRDGQPEARFNDERWLLGRFAFGLEF